MQFWGIALSASLCVGDAAAQATAQFVNLSGDHGVVACLFQATLPADQGSSSATTLDLGVSADPLKPELMGKVRLRQGKAADGKQLLEIGAPKQTALLSVQLNRTDATTVMADMPGPAMAAILRSLARHHRLVLRVSDGSGQQTLSRTLKLQGGAAQLLPCLENLERDLAAYRHVDPTTTIRDVYSPVTFNW